jgi:anthranilate/para-aminobenzoate synthase component II
MTVKICDFEDSFTYNIFSQLTGMGIQCEVIDYHEIKEQMQQMINHQHKQVLILGPGPGHPSEYLFLQDSVLNLMQNSNIMLMGICLGHQLLWYFQGVEVGHAELPVHGQIENYQLTGEWKKQFGGSIQVQRYNSLAVKMNQYTQQKARSKGWDIMVHDEECIMSHNKNVLSYQFHPESVGTSCPEQFFKPVQQFLL